MVFVMMMIRVHVVYKLSFDKKKYFVQMLIGGNSLCLTYNIVYLSKQSLST